MNMSLPKTVAAQGKQLLMDAALRLTADRRSLSAISLRELAREAGLNPNTFYRHFKDFDELGLAIIEQMVGDIRQPLRDLRRQAADSIISPDNDAPDWESNAKLPFMRAAQVSMATVRLFFDYADSHSNAFIMGVRELHGSSPVLRGALRTMMQNFAEDMAEDIEILNLVPYPDKHALMEISEVISREMFLLSMDYIEQPDKHEEICLQADRIIMHLFIGNSLLRGHGKTIIKALEG